MEVGRKVLLQLAKSAPCRLRDARELRPLNGRGGQRSRGTRLFQSVPARDAQCPRPPVKGLSQLRKRAGQSGGRRKRRARFAPQEVSSKPVNECNRDVTLIDSLALRSCPGDHLTSIRDNPHRHFAQIGVRSTCFASPKRGSRPLRTRTPPEANIFFPVDKQSAHYGGFNRVTSRRIVMKRITILIVILCTCWASGAWAQPRTVMQRMGRRVDISRCTRWS